jgi:hypothetical protein
VLAPTKRTTHEWGFTAKGGGGRGGSMSALMADQQQQRHEGQLAAREAEGREKRKWRSDQKVNGVHAINVDGRPAAVDHSAIPLPGLVLVLVLS